MRLIVHCRTYVCLYFMGFNPINPGIPTFLFQTRPELGIDIDSYIPGTQNPYLASFRPNCSNCIDNRPSCKCIIIIS